MTSTVEMIRMIRRKNRDKLSILKCLKSQRAKLFDLKFPLKRRNNNQDPLKNKCKFAFCH